jgi:hypothetical protein
VNVTQNKNARDGENYECVISLSNFIVAFPIPIISDETNKPLK